MKYFLCLLSLLSLFSLIYSACESGTVNVSGDDTEKCGTEITGCVTYDVSSSSTTPKCAVCDGKIPSSNKDTCEACAEGEETKDGKNCYTIIADCEEYAEDGKCAACDVTENKIPAAGTGATCEACTDDKETKDGKNCYTPIADCEEYEAEGKCAACDVAKNKVPVAGTGATCEECAEGKETKDGKNCYTKITDCEEYEAEGKCKKCTDGKETKDGKKCYTKIADCEEYAEEGKCAVCNGKIPSSDKTACEACAAGKETKDGKNCYTILLIVQNMKPKENVQFVEIIKFLKVIKVPVKLAQMVKKPLMEKHVLKIIILLILLLHLFKCLLWDY